MSKNLLISRSSVLGLKALKNISKCCYTTETKKGILGELDVDETPFYDVEPKVKVDEIEGLRDKSRLAPQHRRILNDQKPYVQSMEWYHDTVWYRKKLLGKYGMEAAGVTPAICWPTKAEIEDKLEYERLAYPHSIQEVWKQIEENKKEEALEKRKREEEIDKVVANFDKWRATLAAKVAKKEAELLANKQRRERALQEIREEFGFNIDPRDERYKEMLEKKEKEDRKKKKAEKKQKQNERMLAMLAKAEQAMYADKGGDESGKKSESLENNSELNSSENDDNEKNNKKKE